MSYFTAKATEALKSHGMGDADVHALAEWAEKAKAEAAEDEAARLRGVVIAEDGSIVAETIRKTSTWTKPGATYIRPGAPIAGGVVADLALGEIRRKTGQQVAVITFHDVCEGRVRA